MRICQKNWNGSFCLVASLMLMVVTSGMTLDMREKSVKRFHTEGKASKFMVAAASKRREKKC